MINVDVSSSILGKVQPKLLYIPYFPTSLKSGHSIPVSSIQTSVNTLWLKSPFSNLPLLTEAVILLREMFCSVTMRDQTPSVCILSSCIIPAVATVPTPKPQPTSFPHTVLIANPVWELGSLWQTSLNTPDVRCKVYTATISTHLSLHMLADMCVHSEPVPTGGTCRRI